jgi:hypothetical protein
MLFVFFCHFVSSIYLAWLVGFMVFNATLNNNSVISWWSVLLVEETGGAGENHRPATNTDKFYHLMLYTSPWAGVEPTTLVVIGTDCIASCKSNYLVTIKATTAPLPFISFIFSSDVLLKSLVLDFFSFSRNELWCLLWFLFQWNLK